jgi:hypothetical protein
LPNQAVAWLLVNWWAHDSLHLHVGASAHALNALLGIEFGFHVTIIVAGLILISFLLVPWRNRPGPAYARGQ